VALELDGSIDLLGDHTGTFIAPEVAIQAPKMVDKLVLIEGEKNKKTLTHYLLSKRVENNRQHQPGYTKIGKCVVSCFDLHCIEYKHCHQQQAETND